MPPSSGLHALIAPLRAEVMSGASVVAAMASEALARGAEEVAAVDVEDLRARIADLGVRILDAQPAMAPLVALVARVLEAVAGAADLPAARAAARGAARSFRAGLEARGAALAQRTASLLPEGAAILTLSSSSSVKDALLHRARTHRLEVFVLESRPLQEGHRLAAQLAAAGIPVTVAVDAAAPVLVRRSSCVLLGADSVGDLGVVNKLGSGSAAGAARDAGVPVFVCADRTKILPPGFPQDLGDDRPADEVLRPPAGVKVWNRYFEVVPYDHVSLVITEDAALSPHELAGERAGMRVPEEVRGWAEHRRQGHPDRGPA